jgi:hypothetical protein
MQGMAVPAVHHPSNLLPSMQRALQEAAVRERRNEVAYVTTPEELLSALYARVRHIEIREHLDLATYISSYDPFGNLVTMNIDVNTWSIKVRSGGRKCDISIDFLTKKVRHQTLCHGCYKMKKKTSGRSTFASPKVVAISLSGYR